jgi:hypothetical protein
VGQITLKELAQLLNLDSELCLEALPQLRVHGRAGHRLSVEVPDLLKQGASKGGGQEISACREPKWQHFDKIT